MIGNGSEGMEEEPGQMVYVQQLIRKIRRKEKWMIKNFQR